ncbi:acyltransferase family protein [Roseibium salinum]|uniref:Acyltransferase family protein n=1 Tax=Roseibium salinum TaxID=1604349 RepID=A0ABT3R0R8_9HYPH|nr:acyltransferase family protein [Roseibium sp. DSM 29163]MCX2722744.1 acyltransferase family protein [Roseibium sp. DSM 29163]
MHSSKSSTGQIGYRADIDGLRGIAVSAVILFHANFTLFRGGFVGVDIFFVISGFLITAISLREWELGRFGILRFFEKRARRILPALFLVTAVSVPFALTIPNPLQTKQFLESVLYVLSFSSNFHFWAQTGYFDTSAELKPLLHTWSLAVEEQYYILFPFLLLVLVRLRASLATLFLVVAFILSIGLAQILIDQGQKLTAFYLLPSRVWEILAGVLCALASRKGLADRIVGKVAEILAGIGLVLVMVSIPVFNDNTVTPGPHALIPVVGTALILMFSRSGGRVYRILSNKPLVFIGLISFSAYLWHQPLFAFARLSVDEPLSPAIMGALCLIVVPLSYLSWRFVEVPFRNRATVTLPGFIGTGLPLTAALVLVSVVGIRNYGYIYYRYPEDVASTYETVLRSVNYDFDAAMYDNGDCVFSSRSIKGKTEERFADCVQRYGPATIVIGDSHGMNISNILAKTEAYDFLLGLAAHGHQAHKSHTSNWYHRHVLPFVEQNRQNIEKVIYHQTESTFWHPATEPATSPSESNLNRADVEKVMKLMSDLSAYAQTVWLGPFPNYGADPVRAVFDLSMRTMAKNQQERLFVLDNHVLEVSKRRNFFYARFADLYPVPESPFFDDCTMYKDADHFSSCGEGMVAAWIAKNGTLKALDSNRSRTSVQLDAGLPVQ